ncbi:flavin reductase family protein [Actinokineospora auranticolor]|uniref:Flavin reductase (DIM6/NTAB) family NADH-FMN oxidoreductase RutF n=1 Tax=Actinokineospora auranticolor TaxID=155976 RepID=A0A2S6GB03_9PSEU|nr:flavin reductase family protein [Actinokineospora auranticolor]PPK60542.1 flavin reductase (DIM6/NTAB) family NADH-FMN oxidoreductase RutF [Actinokineospora auranticolor]
MTNVVERLPDSTAFRRAMGLFPTGVALISRGHGPDTEVITVNSLVSVSLDPMLVLISIRTEGRMRSLISARGSFTVNVLGADQEELSTRFAKRDRPRGLDAQRVLGGPVDASGNVLVRGAVTCLECDVDTEHVAGDHVLFLGRVNTIHLGNADEQPLLFHRGSYATLNQ